MASEYTLFQPRQPQPEPVQEQGGFLSRFGIGSKEVEPTQPQSTTSSQYTLFQPRVAQATTPQQKDPNRFLSALAEVKKFGVETLASGTEQAAKGLEGLLNLTRNLPARTFQKTGVTIDKSKVDLPEDQIQYLEGITKSSGNGWVDNAIKNYQEAFDIAKSGSTENIREKKINGIGNMMALLAGQTFGSAARIPEIIQKGEQIVIEENKPKFASDPNFIQDYNNLTTGGKVKKYPLETLRLMAPNIIGSGGVVIGSTILTGGVGTGSLLLASATAEDIREAAVKSGVDQQQAETLGVAAAVPIMLLEKLGFDTILGKGALKDVGKSFFVKVLKSSLTEAGTETLQEGVQMAAEDSFREVTGSEAKSRLAMAALGGAFGGLLFGATAETINNITGKTATKNAENRLEEVVSESPKADEIENIEIKGTDAAPLQNVLGDTLARLREESDKIRREAGEKPTPEVQEALNGADQAIALLQRQYNAQGAREVIQSMKAEQTTTEPTEALFQPNQPIKRTGLIPTTPISSEEKAIPKINDNISDELKPLLEEARKYKSADEFVKAQVNAYHGTTKSDEILKEGFKPTKSARGIGFGGNVDVISPSFFFTDKPETAAFFAKNRAETLGGKASVLAVKLDTKNQLNLTGKVNTKKIVDIFEKAGVNLYDYFGVKNNDLIDERVPSNLKMTASNLWDLLDNKKVVDGLKKQGFDSALVQEKKGLGKSVAIFDQKNIKTKSQLKDIYKQANEANQILREKVTGQTKIIKKPIDGVGYRRVSGLAKKIEAKAIEKDLIDSFGQLPTFGSVNMKEQANLASGLINNDIERAKRIAFGEEEVPENMLVGTVFKAVEKHALENNDIDTLQKLATQSSVSLEASALGQQLQAFREIDKTSPVAVIAEVQKQRLKNAETQKRNIKKEKAEVVDEIKKEIKKSQPKPKDWSSFVDSLKC